MGTVIDRPSNSHKNVVIGTTVAASQAIFKGTLPGGSVIVTSGSTTKLTFYGGHDGGGPYGEACGKNGTVGAVTLGTGGFCDIPPELYSCSLIVIIGDAAGKASVLFAG